MSLKSTLGNTIRILARSRRAATALRFLKSLLDEAEIQVYQRRLKRVGTGGYIWPTVYFHSPENIEFGDVVTVASFVHIWGAGGVTVGNHVMIGSHTAISSVTHDYTASVPMSTHTIPKPIVIGNDVWIGTHSVIMAGVTIHDGAVIGAGAVITKDVPPGAIITGVPGRVYKYRPDQSACSGDQLSI